jgi:1-aminocyclopropane-1-carboxylate synthase 1/2/6
LQLSLDLIEQWSMEHPEASICTAQGASQFRRIANFQDYHGLPEFREVLIKLTNSSAKETPESLIRFAAL